MGCLSGLAVGLVKYILFFANVLFVLSGIAIVVVGAIAQASYTDYNGLLQGKLSGGAIAIIVTGVIIFIIAFFGCCGAIQENRCMLHTYGGLLLCIFIAELSLGIWALSSPSSGDSIVTKDNMMKFWREEYSTKNHSSATFDLLQKDLMCCGVNGPNDYLTSLPVPQTCCPPEKQGLQCTISIGILGNAYSKGCYQAFTEFIDASINLIGIVAICVAFIEVLAIVFAFCLAGHYRD